MSNPHTQPAPISAAARRQLKADATNLRAAATRKGSTLNDWEEREERAAAAEHFELGCWLFYYSGKLTTGTLRDRIDCARRLFLAGVYRPGYQFFTVFDFGERQFDSLFEMGDADQVIDGLREHLVQDVTGKLQAAFQYMGWPTSIEATPT